MSGFNMENQSNYITRMSEEEKITFIKILVALARADGNFDDNEKSFIQDIAVAFGINKDHNQSLLEEIAEDQLIAQASAIKNRQAALQLIKEACLLANSDGDLSEHEIVFIGKIGQAMGIELEKIEQISQWVIDRIVWLEEGKIIFEQV